MVSTMQDLIMERKNLTRARLDVLYQEYCQRGYTTTPLERQQFESLYRKFLSMEIAAWEALEANKPDLHKRLKYESKKLCERLGYYDQH